jgi:hypothetical protein
MKFNWGQININLVNQLGVEANGGFLMVGYHKSSAPISFHPQLIDQINVDLTPIKLIFGAETDF